MVKKSLRWRYYCEFCNKGSGSPSHMKRHEAGCTNNPNRICGMCRVSGIGEEQQPMADLIAALKKDTVTLGALREAAQACPACMLAAIRQSGLQYPSDEEGQGNTINFDFRQEKRDFWADVNDAKCGGEVYY